MLKKTILATLIGSTLLASGASFADPYYRGTATAKWRCSTSTALPRGPSCVHRYYQPRPVIVERHVVVQRPAPVYSYALGNDAGLAILAGAVIGGAIAYHIAQGN